MYQGLSIQHWLITNVLPAGMMEYQLVSSSSLHCSIQGTERLTVHDCHVCCPVHANQATIHATMTPSG